MMLFDLVEFLQNKRRLFYVALFISIDFLLLSLCSQTLQVHRASIATRIHNSEVISSQVQYQGDIFSGGSLSDSLNQAADTLEVGTLRVVVTTIDGLTKAKNGIQAVIGTIFRVISMVISGIVRAIVAVLFFVLRAIGFVLITIVRIFGAILRFTGRVVTFPFIAIGHGTKHAFAAVSGLKNNGLVSVIQPQNDRDNIPVITPEQAQQATLIQENTLAVTPVKPTGAGGACDSGAGNGGYPMEWCDARMDTVQTVSYSSDHINRECTSYAYWYFTAIEGHTDFHVTGNANRWARTSNYPTHGAPAVGAIAVETSGYYGHVAIVQALPGETYEGQAVPAGYVLVSEMNYDWKGHFRYSYSPLSKFSAYIYP
jgi:surface antigen